MVRQGALALSGDAGIKEIREALVAGRFADDPGDVGPPDAHAGDRRRTTPTTACPSSTPRAVPQLKVVLDTGNGMGAVGAAAILPRLPLELVKMYFELDGTFPNHPPDPLEEANRRDDHGAREVGEGRPRHRLGRRRRPLLLHRRHRRRSCRATS